MEQLTKNVDQIKISEGEVRVYDIGDFKLQSGVTLKCAKIVAKVFGSPENPCVVFPTWYSGTHEDNEWLIGSNKTLNPSKYFIVIFNMFGNGLSSSPSNQPPPFDGPRFPNVTLYDNIKAQHKVLTEQLHIREIESVLGWSMGAQQSFQWAAQFPDMVKSIVPFCGSAKTSIHNIVFLEGPKNALMTDAAFADGWYKSQPNKGIKAFARVYAGWGFSQAFYREKVYKTELGYGSLEEFLVGFWEGYFLKKDANNLLCQIWTWQHGDISANELYNFNFEAALKAIKARAIVMPGSTDLYFPPVDNEAEVKLMPNAKFLPIPSIWGHWAGGPGTNPKDAQFIDNALKEVL